MKKVSIIITSYNKSLYIEECLNSILQHERYPEAEFIIVDDRSTDDSYNIIANWIKKNHLSTDRWILCKTDKNMGPAGAINLGLSYASGEVISFFDGDDIILAPFIGKSIAKITSIHPIVYSDGVLFRDGYYSTTGFNQSMFQKFENNTNMQIYNFITENIPSLSISCCLIDRDFLKNVGNFDARYFSNDWIMNIKIFKYLSSTNHTTLFDREPVFAYRISQVNTISDFKKLEIIYEEIASSEYIPSQSKHILRVHISLNLGINSVLSDQYTDAIYFYRKLRKSASYGEIIRKKEFWLFAILFITPIPKKLLITIKSVLLGKNQY